MSALVALALAAAIDGGAAPAAPKGAPAPVATIDRVELDVGGKRVSGWLLDPDGEATAELLLDGGKVLCVPRTPAPKIVDVAKRPITELAPADLVAALGHEHEGARDRCEELLGQLGAAAAPALGDALLSEQAEVRRRALRVLADHPAKQWTLRIKERLRDPEVDVRRAAIAAYAAHPARDQFDAFAALLRFDASLLVRHDAIGQLGRLGDLRAVDLILAQLDGCEDRGVRLVCFDALRRLTNRAFKRDEEAWRAWWTNHREELLAPAPPAEVPS